MTAQERTTLRIVAARARMWHSFADAAELARTSAVLGG